MIRTTATGLPIQPSNQQPLEGEDDTRLVLYKFLKKVQCLRFDLEEFERLAKSLKSEQIRKLRAFESCDLNENELLDFMSYMTKQQLRNALLSIKKHLLESLDMYQSDDKETSNQEMVQQAYENMDNIPAA